MGPAQGQCRQLVSCVETPDHAIGGFDSRSRDTRASDVTELLCDLSDDRYRDQGQRRSSAELETVGATPTSTKVATRTRIRAARHVGPQWQTQPQGRRGHENIQPVLASETL